MGEALLDALLDTLKMFPILLLVYYLIEFLEYKQILRTGNSKLLNGKAAPIFGSLFGCIPQCGFSVVSTDLYTKNELSIGALIAVYIATSDEAFIVMISSPSHIVDLFVIMGIKIVLGIIVGYIAILLYKVIFKNKIKKERFIPKYIEIDGQLIEIDGELDLSYATCSCDYCSNGGKFNFINPLLKTLKTSLYILIVSAIFGVIVYLIGQDNINSFLVDSRYFQPIVAMLVGLIPNCAASIILAELYIQGGLTFGSVIAGLCVNAGLGIVVLIKQNKNLKENIFIISTLIISSLVFGYVIDIISKFIL